MSDVRTAPSAQRLTTGAIGIVKHSRATGLGLLLAVLLGVLVVPPLVVIVWHSLLPTDDIGLGGTLTFSSYRATFQSDAIGSATFWTLVFAVASTAVAVVVGGGLAYLAGTTNVGLQRLTTAGAFVSLAVPFLVRTLGWIYLVNPGHGLINTVLGGPFRSLNVDGMAGMVFVQGFFVVPLAYLLLRGPLANFDRSLDEAASMCGASWVRRARRIWMPVMMPALGSASLLVLILMLQSLEVPILIGVPSGKLVLSSLIYEDLHASLGPSYGQAAVYAVVLLVVVGIALAAYIRVTAASERFRTVQGKSRAQDPIRLSPPLRILGTLFVLLVLLIEVLPIVSVMVVSFEKVVGDPHSGWGLANYRSMDSYGGLTSSVVHSLIAASISACCCVVLGFAVAWHSVRGRSRFLKSLVDSLASIPLVYPGVILSLALLIFFLPLHIPVYGTLVIFVLGFVIAFTPLVVRYAHPAIVQLHPELEEAAHVSGARGLKTMANVVVPLVRSSLGVSWVLVFLLATQDLAIVSLTYGANTNLISTQLFAMYEDGNFGPMMPFAALTSFGCLLLCGFVGGAAFVARRVRPRGATTPTYTMEHSS